MITRQASWEEQQITRASSITTFNVLNSTPDTIWITDDQWVDHEYIKELMKLGYKVCGTFQADSSYMEDNWVSKDANFHNKLNGVNIFHWDIDTVYDWALNHEQWLLDREKRIKEQKK
tara:strand:- start:240 stop:593 length:354 start_codon:yes stop_codon:yes gene_type:complete